MYKKNKNTETINDVIAEIKKKAIYSKKDMAAIGGVMQKIITGRILTQNEILEYVSFLETFNVEAEALIKIAEYCVEEKGSSISYRYILTVGKNWAISGIKTLSAVENNIKLQRKIKSTLKKENEYNKHILFFLSKLNEKDYIIETNIGMPKGTISNWKSNRYKPSLDVVIKIADYYGASIDDIVGREISSQNGTSDVTQSFIPQHMVKKLERLQDYEWVAVETFIDTLQTNIKESGVDVSKVTTKNKTKLLDGHA